MSEGAGCRSSYWEILGNCFPSGITDAEKIEEMLDYIWVYADSAASNEEADRRSKKALELYAYLSNNRGGLLPCQKRGIKIPKAPKGVADKTWGQEIIETLSVAKAPKKDRKGNPYVNKISRHMPLLDAMQTASRKAFRAAFCG